MQIELSYDDAQLLRDLLRQRVVELQVGPVAGAGPGAWGFRTNG